MLDRAAVRAFFLGELEERVHRDQAAAPFRRLPEHGRGVGGFALGVVAALAARRAAPGLLGLAHSFSEPFQ